MLVFWNRGEAFLRPVPDFRPRVHACRIDSPSATINHICVSKQKMLLLHIKHSEKQRERTKPPVVCLLNILGEVRSSLFVSF